MSLRIAVKNYKTYPAFSEETEAFAATLYLDGKRIGEVSNRGQGGSNEYYIAENAERERFEKVVSGQAEERGVAPRYFEFADTLVEEAIDRYRDAQQVRAIQRKGHAAVAKLETGPYEFEGETYYVEATYLGGPSPDALREHVAEDFSDVGHRLTILAERIAR